ncbi:SurA N-terminal domain-containing protein [Virgibacillus sp. DJP39]|uniref:SurA N-terminal domain-containing protein n=1 Tax=Virgibacillus sp. DJP39 TaxID=3409790 RepID=UPI003BB7227D
MKQKSLLIVLAGVLTLLLAACSGQEDAAENNTQSNAEKDNSSDTTEVEKVAKDKVVATVNGEEIKGSKYNDMYSQTLMTFKQGGQDATNAELVQKQTLNRLIEKELILQEAEQIGIEVSSSEISEQLEQIKSQFESTEQYQKQLTELEMTEESLKNQLAFEIKLNKYIEQEVPEVEVTDKEIQTYYEQLASQQGEKAPALEEVKQQIKQTVVKQKRQAKLTSAIEILKEESEVETLL